MNRFFISSLLGFCSLINQCYGEGVFPDIPKKQLPLIKTIPNQEGIILETLTTPVHGDPVQPQNGMYQIEVGIINLASKTESLWDLPQKLLQVEYITCLNSCNSRASWAYKTGQFLFALQDAVYLINRDGSYQKLNLKVPEHPTPIETMESFAITRDAQIVAYHLVYRDPNDSVSGKRGANNADLFIQNTNEVVPTSVPNAKDGFMPDWSPDKTKLAFVASYKNLVISDLNGRVVYKVSPPFQEKNIPLQTEFNIEEVRWSPNGDKVGFVVFERYWNQQNKLEQQFLTPTQTLKHIFYTVNADGSNLKRISVSNNDIDVNSFAWSPSGERIVFRSSYKKEEVCNSNLSFLIQAGSNPCRLGYHLFTSKSDGTDLTQISMKPEFRNGELFWIQ